MKSFVRLALSMAIILFALQSHAQYCVPTISNTGIYISLAGFGPPYGSITGGSNYITNGEGYANRSASSSGTVNRNCTFSLSYNFQNCGNRGVKSFNFRVYADWNQDNDFDDANELASTVSSTIPDGNCAFYSSSISIIVPPNANAGNIRLRWALSESGAATACGGYVGEIEDYTIVVNANIAPVLNSGAVPFFDPLVETQTSNEGLSVGRFIQTSSPAATLISDADQCPSIKSIALIGTSGTNGTWQYKTATLPWTNVSAVSGSNALLLDESCGLRFVPTGPGNSAFTFRAWDKAAGVSGQYYNITATGGSSAFSTVSKTNTITSYSSASSAADIVAYMATSGAAGADYNIVTSGFNKSTGVFKHINNITHDSTNGSGTDIVLDQVNGKIYWIGGYNGTDVLRSNINGTNIETLDQGSFGYPTGIAIGGNKIFIADYGVAIYSMNLDGSNLTAITGHEGQANDIGTTGDIEYDGGKIYYVNQPGSEGAYNIFQANADGSSNSLLVTLANNPVGLDVINGSIYWTENDGVTGYIRTRTLANPTITTLLTAAGQNPLDLEVSPGNTKIYFVDIDMQGNNPYINSIPINGGEVTRELALENSVNSLVFNRDFTTLPVQFINVKASPQNSLNLVEWNIGEETNVNHYVIQQSADGVNFTNAGTVIANGAGRYQWPDPQPLQGNTFYRINAVDNDGRSLYSAIVLVNRQAQVKSISVTPSIITTDQFTLRLQNLSAGSYQLNVYNSNGQKIILQKIQHSGGATVQSITLPAGLSKGLYRVVVTGNNEMFTTGVVVQ